MAQQRPFHQMLIDTTFTKIFVGGLAWETRRDTMRRYFEQFGEIHEAVVITDKHTGKSKGYGFVTFKDPDAAARACTNPSPVIDGRRANCNLATLGATKPYPQFPHPPHHGDVAVARFRPLPALVAHPVYHATSSNPVPHSAAQFPVPYSAYGYSGYSPNVIYPPPVTYCGRQQYSPYYSSRVAGQPNVLYPDFYPYYGHYAGQIAYVQGYGMEYQSQIVQLPYNNLQPTPTTG